MPAPLIAGLLLNSAGALLNNVINRNSATEAYNRQRKLDALNYERQQELMRQQFNYNKAASEYAWNKEHEFWAESNAYNSPAAQLSRLRQAGINPALSVGGINNTSSMSLNADSPQVSSASAPSSSAPQAAASASLPDVSNLLNSVKTLELLNEQVNTQKAQQEYLKSISNANNVRTEERLAGKAYWDVNARYDSNYKQFAAQSLYRDVLDKIYRYTNFLPHELQSIVLKNAAQDLDNRFQSETFDARKNAISLENNVLKAREKEILQNVVTSRAQSRNLGSQIAFRNWYMTEQNKNFEQSRALQFSNETLNKVRSSMLELQSQVASAMSKGDYTEAIKKGVILNFYQQMLQGTLFKDMPDNPFKIFGSQGFGFGDGDDMRSTWSILKALGL